MKDILMGIDLGTTHIKAGAFDVHGNQVAISIVKNTAHYDDNGYSHFEPAEIKAAVYKVIADTIKKIDVPFNVLGISVSSMVEAGLPIDSCGNPLYPIITWFDQRTLPQVKWWNDNTDPYEVYKETGLVIHPRCSLNKIMWIRENEREVYDKMVHWLSMEDYVLYCLSGSIATSSASATRTMAMNISNMTWSDKMLGMAEVSKDIFPSIYPGGTIIGRVSEEASKASLLKEGTPVLTGGHDHLCAALASGVMEEGDLFDSMGTAESLVAITDKLMITEDVFKSGFCVGRNLTGNNFCIMGGISSSGASVEWFGKNIVGKDSSGESIYKKFDQLALEMKPEPSGIFFTPYITGRGTPVLDYKARGSFIGIRSEHTKADLLKSVYEGVSYECRLALDTLEKISGAKIKSPTVTGGSTKNQYWMNVKANVLGRNLDIPSIEEAAVMGAAILAGLGTGVYKDLNDVKNKIKISHRFVNFDQSMADKYNFLYENGYKKIYDSTKLINEVLAMK